MTPAAWAAFLVAAAVGAPARYLLDGWVQGRTGGAFPWGTFTVNVTGCLALGVLTGLGLHHGLGPTPRAVLGSGGLGAYTTFSTFAFETVRLAEEGAVDTAVRNAAAGLLAGLAAAAAGLALTTLPLG
ncbi:MAG TPA: fluoride efflux transporter CrcB [Acidimicrobiales bacterium]|nr:fluoride efflux transporter CrcB [Acidimicrobiales bacterium]